MSRLLIDSNNGRLGNQLFPLMAGISLYFQDYGKYKPKILFKNEGFRISEEFLESIHPDLFDLVSFNNNEFQQVWENETSNSNLININSYWDLSNKTIALNNSVLLRGFLQEKRLVNERACQKVLYCKKEIIDTLISRLGEDIKDSVCLHVRRGDYLTEQNLKLYISLTKSWIRDVILTYYPGRRIICISDDINWCKENLIFDQDEILIDFFENSTLSLDFWLQTVTFGNICSCSTFSLSGAMLNPNLNAVIPTPYYRNTGWEKSYGSDMITPNWMIKHSID